MAHDWHNELRQLGAQRARRGALLASVEADANGICAGFAALTSAGCAVLAFTVDAPGRWVIFGLALVTAALAAWSGVKWRQAARRAAGFHMEYDRLSGRTKA